MWLNPNGAAARAYIECLDWGFSPRLPTITCMHESTPAFRPTDTRLRTRSVRSATTAAGVLAVLSLVVTAASAVSGPAVGSDVRVTLSDGNAMRLMAAAVAAAARDLIGADHACEAAGGTPPATAGCTSSIRLRPPDGLPHVGMILDERLLDLPPPA